MLVKKLILILICSGSLQLSKSEYIIFKKNNKGSIRIIKDNNLYSIIYDTLLKYQWPTCIAFFHKVNPTEIIKYTARGDSFEESYLRSKLKESDKNLDIAFIPTSLYELFFIINREKYHRSFKLNGFYCELDLRNILKYPNNFDNIYKNILECNYISSKDISCNLHLAVNNDLVDCIKNLKFYKDSREKNITNLIKKNINIILDDLLSKIDFREEWHQKTFEKVLNLEYRAHKNNSGLLYRGNVNLATIENSGSPKHYIEFTYLASFPNSSFNDLIFSNDERKEYERLISKEKSNNLTYNETIKLKNLKKVLESFCWVTASRSISYGNSLFAGMFFDRGACSYHYMQKKSSLGYALQINKWLYYQGIFSPESEKKFLGKLIDGELFTISPLNTISALFGVGEHFHSRSKSYYFSQDLMRADPIYILGMGQILDLNGYFAKNGSPLKRGAELAEFIAERAEIIKLPQDQGGFNFLPQAARNYLDNQNEIAQWFGTMTKLESNLTPKL